MPLAILCCLFIVLFFFTRIVKKLTIFESERGLRYRKGKFTGVLSPGSYWYPAESVAITKVDVRVRYIVLAGQEVLTADNVTLKLSVTAAYQYSDLETAFIKVQNVDQAVYLELQQVVRELAGQTAIDSLLEARPAFDEKLKEAGAPRLQPLGVELTRFAVRDIGFPGDLKKAFSEVVRARKEGLAALERARGESAALRNLANAAKVMEGNPALLQLRLLQTLSVTNGNTIVLGVPPNGVLPVGKKGSPEIPAAPDPAAE